MREAFLSKIILGYMRSFPNTPKLTLAKKIYSEPESKKLFKSVEHIRSLIRSVSGANGDYNRKNLSQSIKEEMKEINALKKAMPKGESERVLPYVLPKSSCKVLVISDIHIPMQSDEALFAAIEFGHKQEVDTIIINGDLIDFYQLSRFEKDPRKRSIKYEIDATKVFLDGLRKVFPKALIVWALGNHCSRFEKYIMQKAPELLDIEALSIDQIFDLNRLNIHLVESNQYIYAGKLMIAHGHNIGLMSGGVNPARSARLKIGRSILIGHFHRETKDMGRVVDEKPYAAYSAGCLCDLYPNYLPVNAWSHGFAYIELDKNGNFHLSLKTIIDGKVY